MVKYNADFKNCGRNLDAHDLINKCVLDIGLPGCKYNPIGQRYYSDLFIH